VQAFERFLTGVRLGARADRPAAETTAQAVLTTLFERLSGGQAADMVEQLKPPDGFVPARATLRNRPAEAFDLEEFLRRVAHREHGDNDAAQTHASVVVHALQLAIPAKEVRDAVDQLPAEFAVLLSSPWRPQQPLTADRELVRLVADRSGLAPEEAGQVTEGVLEVLAERLPDKEVDALLLQLGDGVRAALERGRADRTAPRRLTVDKFLAVVGERLQTDPTQARERARPVLSAVVELIDDRLLADLLTELPDDYADLLC
jgi:uncharacterized protein (DUF2267 family)